jgi:hypothetical protein
MLCVKTAIQITISVTDFEHVHSPAKIGFSALVYKLQYSIKMTGAGAAPKAIRCVSCSYLTSQCKKLTFQTTRPNIIWYLYVRVTNDAVKTYFFFSL